MIILGLIFSIAVFTAPVIFNSVRKRVAEKVSKDFKRIEFSLNLFFYTEGFEITDPKSVDLKTLVKRYYLRKNPSRYSIYWLDSNVEDDGKISAIVYYTSTVDPVELESIYPRVEWFDRRSKRLHEDYREGLMPSIVVEVIKSW